MQSIHEKKNQTDFLIVQTQLNTSENDDRRRRIMSISAIPCVVPVVRSGAAHIFRAEFCPVINPNP